MDIQFRYRQAHDILRAARGVVVVAHRKPDGDTLGAATAVLNHCVAEGMRAAAFCVSEVPSQYFYMPGTETYVTDPSVFAGEDHDVVAVFDSGDLEYAGIAEHLAGRKGLTILNFDHHVTNEGFGDVNIVDPTASSTAEVVYRFFLSQGVEIRRGMATCLLTGILTDTGSFTNPATTSGSFSAASDMLRRGAKLQEVSRNLVRNKPLPALRLWGDVLARLRFNERLGVASTVVFADDMRREGIDEEHVEGISNFLNTFLDAKVVLVLRELPGGKVKGSFRTAEDVDVSAIAKAMGGGGHRKAAGFTVPGRIVEGDRGWKVEPPS